MPNITLGLLTGILIQLNLTDLIDPLWLIILIIASIGITYLFDNKKLGQIIISLFFGILLVSYTGNNLINKLLPKKLENKTLSVVGQIKSPIITSDTKIVFDFKVTQIEDDNTTPYFIRLSWYKQNIILPELSVGDEYKLDVKLKRPNGFKNKRGFDYQTWLFTKGYSAIGYIKNTKNNMLLSSNPYIYSATNIRQFFYSRSNQILKNSQYKGLYQALVLGIKNAIAKEQTSLMRATGTSHLLAISGLHIGIIAVIFFAFGKIIWHLSNWFQKHINKIQFSLLISLVGALIYAFMAGFSLPTQRALIMLMAIILSSLMYRKNCLWNSFWLALFLILLLDPLAPLQSGFWLSFGAIVIIFSVLSFIKNKNFSSIQIMLIIQFAISIALAPVLLINFNTLSLNSFVANLFAIPIASFIIIPLGFIMMLSMIVYSPLTSMLVWLLDNLFNLYFSGLNLINSIIPFQIFSNIEYTMVEVALFCLILFFAFQIHRYFSLVIAFAGIVVSYPKKIVSDYSAHIFDVGQGLAVLISTHNHVLLYDTGPAYSKKFTSVESVILPYLKSKGIKQLDKLVLSHYDSDHIGDYQTLLKAVNVKKIETGQPTFFKDDFDNCHKHNGWTWDTIHFEYLTTANKKIKDNNFSCVLKVSGPQTLLIPGDIEQKQEQVLIAKYSDTLESDIMILAHHGSKTSSSVSFLNVVKPDVAISSNGYLSRFGHPHEIVVKRIKNQGIIFYSTELQGAMTIDFLKEGFEIRSVKQETFNKWFNF